MPFYDDDGTEINPDLVPKPSLCVMCRHDDDPGQLDLCLLTRFDQQDGDDFICDAFTAK